MPETHVAKALEFSVGERRSGTAASPPKERWAAANYEQITPLLGRSGPHSTDDTAKTPLPGQPFAALFFTWNLRHSRGNKNIQGGYLS